MLKSEKLEPIRIKAKIIRYKKLLYIAFAVCFLFIFQITAFAEGTSDMFTLANDIINDIYEKIVSISTVLAGLISSVAVIGAKLSNNQHKVDQAWDWLKRVWIAWAVINGIGAFIAYIVPLFDGWSTLNPNG